MDRPVLIVEDDANLVDSIDRNLRARGYAVVTSPTVAAAEAAIAADDPGLILLDVDLPDGSGWEILRRLREHANSVPVIVVSGLRPNPRLVQELGCVAVLEKPFPMEALIRLIRDCTAGASPATLAAGAAPNGEEVGSDA